MKKILIGVFVLFAVIACGNTIKTNTSPKLVANDSIANVKTNVQVDTVYELFPAAGSLPL